MDPKINNSTIVIPGLTRDLGGCVIVRGPGSALQERLDRDDNLL